MTKIEHRENGTAAIKMVCPNGHPLTVGFLLDNGKPKYFIGCEKCISTYMVNGFNPGKVLLKFFGVVEDGSFLTGLNKPVNRNLEKEQPKENDDE